MTELKPPPDTPSALSKQRLRLWLRLLRVTRRVEGALRENLRTGHESTLPRFDVLATLHRHSAGLRMSELSAHLKVSNGNVTGIVERLVSEGLAERASVEGDRRAMRVRLTEAGRARFARMAAEHEAWIDEMFGDIGEGELDTMIDLLDRIGKERSA